VVNSGPVVRGPIRLADLYKIAAQSATKPIKVSVGAGPVNLAWHVHFRHYKNPRDLSLALAPIFNAEMKELVGAGAKYMQIEDLGAWLPLFTNNDEDYKWIGDVIAQCVDGVKAKIAWHFCFGNAWGNALTGLFPKGYETVLPFFSHLPIDQFVLDFANREMAGIECLRSLPRDKEVQVGVIDVRTTMVETPEQVAARIRKVLEVVPPDLVYVSTDCGMKTLPRIVVKLKLRALAQGAAIVRREVE
jgi:5-methyltetrahydropteroyltriglutamate--homocysteine methyltransferase